MLAKTSHTLIGTLVFFALAPIAANRVMAEPVSDSPANEPIHVSQLLGHDDYPGAPEKTLADYQVGTVVGKAGEITSVRLEDGTIFQSPMPSVMGNQTGFDVLVVEEDGEYEIVGSAHPMWITELEQDYGYNVAVDTRLAPLSERTASLWQALAESEAMAVDTTTTTTVPQPQPAVGGEAPVEEPVRGLW